MTASSKPRMPTKLPLFFVVAAGLLISFSCGVGAYFFGDATTAESLSPAGTRTVLLQEARLPNVDRNFWIVLRDETTSPPTSTVVFRSPDEPGSSSRNDRFIWSSNGRYVLLVGDKFFVKTPPLLTAQGETVYLMLDTQTGAIWCNSDQMPEYPSLTRQVIAQQKFDVMLSP